MGAALAVRLSKVRRERVIRRHMGNLREPMLMTVIILITLFRFTLPIFLILHVSFLSLVLYFADKMRDEAERVWQLFLFFVFVFLFFSVFCFC